MGQFTEDAHATLATPVIVRFATQLREEARSNAHPNAMTTVTEETQSKQQKIQKMETLMTSPRDRHAVCVEPLRHALHCGIEVTEP